MNRDVALDIVYQAIDVVNGLRPADKQIPCSPELVLVGEDGILDSLGLVTLVLAIERKIGEVAGVEVDLVGLDAFNPETSRLQTPVSIAELVLEQLP